MSDLNKLTTINIQEKSNIIWGVADILRDYYKPHEYGKVILPMCVLKRFNDVLAPTKEKVLEKYEEVKDLAINDGFLQKASGYSFYNTSHYDFQKLTEDPTHIESNFRDFWNGFSDNVKDILENYKFDTEIETLVKEDLLFSVIEAFNKPSAYMGVDKVTAVDMGYIFEDLIKRFSESYGEDAGSHFTSRDIVYLMTDLLIVEDKEELLNDDAEKTVYDMAMGTSQMLTSMTERLKEINPNINVRTFGQEINRETYAIAKSSALIHDQNANNMKQGNTLSNDQFSGYTFDYCISNPPFGVDYKSALKSVQKEHDLGAAGRFPTKLPNKGDGQMLFTLNGISKLNDSGRLAIIHNASPLFKGSVTSGESDIRKYIIENDWLETIIQLSNDVFYNTNITTYIWILTKNKSPARKGKIQLIDAKNMVETRDKNIGKKRYDITSEYRNFIIDVYTDFKNKTYSINGKTCKSKIFSNEDFGYKRVTIKTSDDDGVNKYNENIPLIEDIDDYFEREVKPYNSNAVMDSKFKIGYEIPFTRYFYKYTKPQSSKEIEKEIINLEREIDESLNKLFEGD